MSSLDALAAAIVRRAIVRRTIVRYFFLSWRFLFIYRNGLHQIQHHLHAGGIASGDGDVVLLSSEEKLIHQIIAFQREGEAGRRGESALWYRWLVRAV